MRAARLGVLVVLAASAAWAQRRADFLGVTQFRGTLTLSMSSDGPELSGGKVSVRASASAAFVMDRVAGVSTPTWRGRMTSSSSTLTFDGQIGVGSCVQTESFTISGPLEFSTNPLPQDVELRLNGSSWELAVYRYYGPRQDFEAVITCPNNPGLNRKEKFRGGLYIPRNYRTESYPPSGLILTSNHEIEDDADYAGAITPNLVTWKHNLRIEPNVDDIILEITSGQYRDWRPTAQRDGTPGDPIELTATVKRKGTGEALPLDVERFEWELIDTSQEPGVAINWPREAKDSEFDLRFQPQGDQIPETERRQKIVRVVRNTASDRAKIEPIDWGGWGTLRVVAFLRDGRKLVGRLAEANEDDVRLPKRQLGSLIADVWKEQARAMGKPDSADDEDDPKGDGTAGDGLTLYEEYRGFYENLEHKEGDPLKKEYFAVNLAGGEVDAGLAHFQTVTGLVVHSKMLRTELGVDRVINTNRRAAPKRTDQHGVFYQYGAERGVARAQGGPGTPKMIQRVTVPLTLPVRATATAGISYAAVTVAHEALHTVNVYHHGQGDKEVTWTGRNGVLLEDGTPITALREDRSNATASWAKSLDGVDDLWQLGIKNAQHSGAEECVMRYDISNAYLAEGLANTRYLVKGSESPGTSLCSGGAGTGVNADGRDPQPRYFGATAGRGNCKSQIAVSDAGNATVR